MRAILIALLLTVATQARAECGNLCVYNWWNKANAEDVQAALDAGADAMARDVGYRTPLHYAAAHVDPAAIQLLLNAGADANARDNFGETPLHAMSNSFRVEMTENQALLDAAQALLDAGANLNARNAHGYTPLPRINDGEHKLTKLFMLIVDAGANLNTRDYSGSTRLHTANWTEARLLIEAGADLNLTDGFGHTVLYKMAGSYKIGNEDEFIEIARLLISTGADLEIIAGPDSVPLLSTAVLRQPFNGTSTKLIELIIGSDVNVNAADKNNFTPIMYAAQVSGADVVKLLLDAGADVTTKTTGSNGYTAWDLAQSNPKLKNTAQFWSLAEGSGQCGRLCDTVWWHNAKEADLREILNLGIHAKLKRDDFNTSFELLKKQQNLRSIQAYWALQDAYWALFEAQYN